jgi:ATP-dependent RNA helicase DDX5/DBP2
MRRLDMIGLAETGSGKTLAYLLPALVHVNAQPVPQPGDGPIALILAPTRELAAQIHEESVRFGHPCGVRTACVVGGLPKGAQIKALRKAPEVVVATPGRLNDLLSARRTKLVQCTYLVLDEADRMLDMGFEPQIRQLLAQMKADRQTLLFSATWPFEVQALAKHVLLPGSVMVEVGGALAEGGRANARIEQRVTVCDEGSKVSTLVGLLEEYLDVDARLMIFCASKRRCDDLTRALRLDGWPALAIHGDKSQEERDWVLEEFKAGTEPLLVATDVAQRGLDIKDVRCVINFDCPSSGEAYVHRIGRTGRAGSTGSAHTLLTQDDARVATELVKVLRGAAQLVPEELELLVARAGAT